MGLFSFFLQIMIEKSKEKRKEIHIRRKKNKRRNFRRKCHLVKRRIRTKNMDIMKGMGKKAKMKTMNVLKDIDKVMMRDQEITEEKKRLEEDREIEKMTVIGEEGEIMKMKRKEEIEGRNISQEIEEIERTVKV